MFTVLENNKNLKYNHTQSYILLAIRAMMLSHILSLENSTVHLKQNENGNNVCCYCENSFGLLDPLNGWVLGLQGSSGDT